MISLMINIVDISNIRITVIIIMMIMGNTNVIDDVVNLNVGTSVIA